MNAKGCLSCLVLAASAYGLEQNLLTNPGFEEAGEAGSALGWKGANDVYRRDVSTARSGKASLKCSNADPGYYRTCEQSIPCVVGRRYEFEAWVKSKGVTGGETGATICVQWWDTAGNYVGGSFLAGVKGDSDWTKVHGMTPRLPENAARCTVECYLAEGMTGTAWFDDVSVRLLKGHPMKTLLQKPNYRGEIRAGTDAEIVVGVRIDLTDWGLSPRQVLLRWRLWALAGGGSVLEGEREPEGGSEEKLVLKAGKLQPGEYAMEIDLVKKATGKSLLKDRHRIHCVNRPEKRLAYIDEHNRLIFHGKPFFPLGMYWLDVTPEQLDIYAESAFNCLMPYNSPNRAQMDMCLERGMQVIYSVKDSYFGTGACTDEITSRASESVFLKGKVTAFKDHPALLAWYINDELGPEHLDRLIDRQRQMQALDPGHPTWAVLYQIDHIGEYVSTCDVLGTDPYPIPNDPPSLAGQWTRRTRAAAQGTRPVWQVPQVFDWVNYPENPHYPKAQENRRPPTLEEMRSMAWQCIAEGANGLVFYSWFDLHRPSGTGVFKRRWPEVKTVAREISNMIPVLLSVKLPPAIKVAGGSTPAWLNWTVRQRGDSTYLIAVNNSRQDRKLVFELPREPRSVQMRGGRTGVFAESRSLSVPFAPLEVRIYEIKGLKR